MGWVLNLLFDSWIRLSLITKKMIVHDLFEANFAHIPLQFVIDCAMLYTTDLLHHSKLHINVVR